MQLNWELPYRSRRVPVFARNAVATSHPLAAQAGLLMLRNGGNAIDAALACAIALTVVEPCSNGIGSDVFALLWDGKEVHGLNGSGRSPASWSSDKYVGKEPITIGWRSITVPGAVDAWVTLSKRFGRLAFTDLFEPALNYADQGFVVSPTIQKSWARATDMYAEFDGFQQAFSYGGRAPRVGELFKHPEQAETLRKIASSDGKAFYQGELAEQMVEYFSDIGCELSRSDLAEHRSEWVTPISMEYHDVTVLEMPPNAQGIAALIALGILNHVKLEDYPLDSADSVHLQIEATKIGLHIAQAQVADPDHMRVSVDQLLDEEVLKKYAANIKMDRASRVGDLPTGGGTVYLTTADESGMMVSFIQSNFWGFGSGIVVPGTGISLQNRAAGFSVEANHPNVADGGKRPFHTIIPGFILRNGVPLMSFGVMGAHMQAQGHVQVITRIFTYAQNPQAASDAPRWYIEREGGGIVFEEGFNDGVIADLVEKRGHIISTSEPQFAFGGAQLIYRLDNGVYCAASDHRKDGQAVGF